MQTLRIFVSSPGDVAAERAAVCRMLDELEGNHLLSGIGELPVGRVGRPVRRRIKGSELNGTYLTPNPLMRCKKGWPQ